MAGFFYKKNFEKYKFILQENVNLLINSKIFNSMIQCSQQINMEVEK